MGKTFKIVGDDMSDGYHTFDELYEHRCLLFLALCREYPNECYYKKDYETWFCVYLELPEGQISYHVPDKFLPIAEKYFHHRPDHKWDGHKSEDVIMRLKTLATR